MKRPTLQLTALALILGLFPAGLLPAGQCPAQASDCVRRMAAEFESRGWIGLKITYDESSQSVVVKKVFPDSPASTAGLQAGDRLLALNGVPYNKENEQQIKGVYKSLEPGDEAHFQVRRGDREMAFEVAVTNLPEALIAQWIGQHLLHEHAGPIHEHGD